MLLGVSGLTNNRKILHIAQRDFLKLIAFRVIKKYVKGAVVQLLKTKKLENIFRF